jgi:serine/threonine protein kinase
VVHHDIKPDNFLIQQLPNQTTRVVLSGFGMSTAVSGKPTTAWNSGGTTSYKAPEIVVNVQRETSVEKVYKKMPSDAYTSTHNLKLT